MGLQHPFNMVGKWEFWVPQALVWAMLVLGSCRAISFRELLKSYRNPIGSRIVFLCHHFSEIFLLLNFGRVAFFSGGMSNLLVTLSAWWQGSQHRESELRGAGCQTGESSGKGENGKGSEKPLVFSCEFWCFFRRGVFCLLFFQNMVRKTNKCVEHTIQNGDVFLFLFYSWHWQGTFKVMEMWLRSVSSGSTSWFVG